MIMQVERVLYLYKKLEAGNRVYLKDYLNSNISIFENISQRTLQRDMRLIKDIDNSVEKIYDSKEVYYKMNKSGLNLKKISIESNELLSLYILKAHLKLFNRTQVSDVAESLLEKIEKFASGNVFDSKELFWDKNFGNYNYMNNDTQISRVITAITKSKWVEVSYASGKGKPNIFICKLIRMFTYNGSLYAVAYVPHHSSFIALLIQNIDEIQFIDKISKELQQTQIPKFDPEEFSKNRFGVFYGKPEKIELEIDKEFVKYFENRFWHSTQNLKYQSNGNLTLKMNTHLSPELIAWIMSWSSAITIIKPEKLKNEIINNAKMIIEKYK